MTNTTVPWRAPLFLFAVAAGAGAWACGSDGGGSNDGGADAVVGDGSTLADGAGDGGTTDAGCPPYEIACNGGCVPATSANNCGSCGNACPSNQFCTAGGCVGTCPPGLDGCGGVCVDLQVDDANCGACGAPCAANEGCVAGQCVAAWKPANQPACAGGGPPIKVGDAGTCLGQVAQTSFTWGLCSCVDAQLTAETLIDGWNSTQGPYKTGVMGGGLGVNHVVSASSKDDIWGPLWAAASSGTAVTMSSQSTVHHDFQSGAGVTADLACKKDAYVGGNIVGPFDVTQTLYQPASASRQNVTYGKLVTQPVTVAPPCDCTNKIPVGAYVAFAKTTNDDASIGLDPAILAKPNAPARIDLPCGSYYLTGFSLPGSSAIVVHGKTAIFIDGDIDTSGFLEITLDTTMASELDVFVSGTITSSSQFKFGSPNTPALARLYIGGTSTFAMSSQMVIAGEVWVGNAPVDWTSQTDMFGAIFAGDFTATAKLNLHHDQAIDQVGSPCNPPDAGTCGSCKDCGNQACINGTCGACTSSAQCCPPLVCQGGTCVPPIN